MLFITITLKRYINPQSIFLKADLTEPPQIFDAHLLENTDLSPSRFHFSMGFIWRSCFESDGFIAYSNEWDWREKERCLTLFFRFFILREKNSHHQWVGNIFMSASNCDLSSRSRLRYPLEYLFRFMDLWLSGFSDFRRSLAQREFIRWVINSPGDSNFAFLILRPTLAQKTAR